MSNENLLEVYRQLRQSQDKYTYFLLAAVGAAIGLAINQTQGSALSWSQIPLGCAVLCWSLSFIYGCRHLVYTSTALYANAARIGVERGEDPAVGRHPHMIGAASTRIQKAFEENAERANRNSGWQFRFLVIGAIFYIAWHLLEMLLKTLA